MWLLGGSLRFPAASAPHFSPPFPLLRQLRAAGPAAGVLPCWFWRFSPWGDAEPHQRLPTPCGPFAFSWPGRKVPHPPETKPLLSPLPGLSPVKPNVETHPTTSPGRMLQAAAGAECGLGKGHPSIHHQHLQPWGRDTWRGRFLAPRRPRPSAGPNLAPGGVTDGHEVLGQWGSGAGTGVTPMGPQCIEHWQDLAGQRV